MYKPYKPFNLDPFVDATIVCRGCCFIKSAMGHLTLTSVDECIKRIIHTISVDENVIYAETIHYGSDKHYIDVIKMERRNKSDFL